MKVVLSTIGTFHTFDLARELHARGALQVIFTGYPRFKLQAARLPVTLIRNFPWMHTPYLALSRMRVLSRTISRECEYFDNITFDRHVSRNMPDCEIFVGLSGSALRSGRVAHARGAKYVCDRACTHIRTQHRLVTEEYERWGSNEKGVDPRVIALEESEYAEADRITVPSTFSVKSFIDQGVPPSKLRRLSYGVDLTLFHRVSTPPADKFDILFVGGMSFRKGVPYLLQAYKRLEHSNKSITFVGVSDPSLIKIMKNNDLWPSDARVIGHVPQRELKEIMSRSHVMVLPSIEEGLAMVQAQAMACGCPVIASMHTGAPDIFDDGIEGFIVPIRQADAIAERLQKLADDPTLGSRMGEAGMSRLKLLGGWRAYGDEAIRTYKELIE